jgi:anti-sigma regulatory factor (Ser/Thr protein kinase)
VGTRISLDVDPRSVGQARRFCAATLDGWGADPDLVSTCVLLVSELATNAVLHARTAFTVSIERGERLRIEVDDGDPRMPHARDYSLDAMSGRGLHLVEALSRASGAQRHGEGKTVWFEVDWEEAMVP